MPSDRNKSRAEEVSRQLEFDWSGAANDIESDLGDVAAESAGGALNAFGLQAGSDADIFRMVDVDARNWAKTHAAELVTQISDGTREFIRSAVVQALDDGWSAAELKRELMDGYTFSNSRALMISRTEVALAHGKAGDIAARDSGRIGQKEWLASSDACDDCIPNQDQGPIELEEDFDSGDSAPPAHPNCRCSITYSPIAQG
jgi:hypothetical protein